MHQPGSCRGFNGHPVSGSRQTGQDLAREATPVVPICRTVIDATRFPTIAASSHVAPAQSEATIPAVVLSRADRIDLPRYRYSRDVGAAAFGEEKQAFLAHRQETGFPVRWRSRIPACSASRRSIPPPGPDTRHGSLPAGSASGSGPGSSDVGPGVDEKNLVRRCGSQLGEGVPHPPVTTPRSGSSTWSATMIPSYPGRPPAGARGSVLKSIRQRRPVPDVEPVQLPLPAVALRDMGFV